MTWKFMNDFSQPRLDDITPELSKETTYLGMILDLMFFWKRNAESRMQKTLCKNTFGKR